MLQERLQRAGVEVVVVDGAIVDHEIDRRRNRGVAAGCPINRRQRANGWRLVLMALASSASSSRSS